MAQVITERAPITDLGVVTGPDAAYRASIALGNHIGNHAFDVPTRNFLEGLPDRSPATTATAVVAWDGGRSVDIFPLRKYTGGEIRGMVPTEFDGASHELNTQAGAEGMAIPAHVRTFSIGSGNPLEMNGSLRSALEHRKPMQRDPKKDQRTNGSEITFIAVVPSHPASFDF